MILQKKNNNNNKQTLLERKQHVPFEDERWMMIINSPSVLVVVVEDLEDSARNTTSVCLGFLLHKLHRGAQELAEADQLPESEWTFIEEPKVSVITEGE